MRYQIYKLTFNNSDLFYVGQTYMTLAQRLYNHQRLAHSGAKTRLHVFMRNKGIMNVKIKSLWKLETDDKEFVDDFEQFYIRMLQPKLNIAIRKIRTIGYTQYMREYRQKMREEQRFLCSVCHLNCSSRLQLIHHLQTRKHLNKENELLNYYARL